MNTTVDQAMSRVINAMYERVGDELTVDDLAHTAMYSKFHFSRMFRQVTGVSPGRFLSALRFQEAKRLLVATSLSVAEISNRVGYSSLGTFSTRFKKFVGVTPTEYRRTGGCWSAGAFGDGNRTGGTEPAATLHGRVCATTAGECGETFVGVFPDAVPHCAPVTFTVLSRPGHFELRDVPEGTWYLLAYGVFRDPGGQDPGNGHPGGGEAERAGGPAGSVGRLGPITVHAGATVEAADVQLRPMRTVDLPVVSAPFAVPPWPVNRRGAGGTRTAGHRGDRSGIDGRLRPLSAT